jgi:hypothetical protein
VPGEKAQAKGWRLWLEEEMGWQLPDGDSGRIKNAAADGQPA